MFFCFFIASLFGFFSVSATQGPNGKVVYLTMKVKELEKGNDLLREESLVKSNKILSLGSELEVKTHEIACLREDLSRLGGELVVKESEMKKKDDKLVFLEEENARFSFEMKKRNEQIRLLEANWAKECRVRSVFQRDLEPRKRLSGTFFRSCRGRSFISLFSLGCGVGFAVAVCYRRIVSIEQDVFDSSKLK